MEVYFDILVKINSNAVKVRGSHVLRNHALVDWM